MADEKITAFATAVGTDIKEIKIEISNKASQSDLNTVKEAVTATTSNTLQEANNYTDQVVQDLKSEILGEGAPENLDTLKEIADILSNSSEESATGASAKLADHEQRLAALENLDLLSIYNANKM